MGWVGGRRGGRRGRRVVVVVVVGGVVLFGGSVGVLLSESWSVVGEEGGSMRAPAHASRRCMYVRKPSFHLISSSSISLRFRFRDRMGWARSSGVSNLYGFNGGEGGA